MQLAVDHGGLQIAIGGQAFCARIAQRAPTRAIPLRDVARCLAASLPRNIGLIIQIQLTA